MKNNTETTVASTEQLSHLPTDLRIAQEAIKLPEVQEIMMKLAKYNLGVFMPHMHNEGESFAVLPADFVQVEKGLKVSFSEKDATLSQTMIPVAWRWQGGRVTRAADCAGDDSDSDFAPCSWCHCSG